MPVPTTLQGNHDGCGGTVVFRPGTHRRDLLEGRAVVLHAACRSCGETLSTEWALPAHLVDETLVQVHDEQFEEALPLAAGAEEWQPQANAQPAPPQLARDHGGAQPASAEGRPVASLGAWRMREEGSAQAAAPQLQRPSTIGGGPAPQRQQRVDDPALAEHMSRFSARIDAARDNLRRMNTDLPASVVPDPAEATFRAPQLSRRSGLPPAGLSAMPTGLRSSTAPAAPTVPAPAVDAAISTAVVSPSFHDDAASAPIATPVETPAPAPMAAPMLPPTFAQPAAFPSTDADVFPPAVPAVPVEVVAPAPAPPAPALVAPALAAPAPVVPASVTPAPPTPVAGPTTADAAADVWGMVPAMSQPVPAELTAAVQPATPAVTAPQLPAPAPATPAAPSFPDAFAEAAVQVPTPMAPAATAPAAPAPDVTSPELGGTLLPAAAEAPALAMPAPAEAVVAPATAPGADAAIEPTRGFDWGPTVDKGASTKTSSRRARRAARRQDTTAAAVPVIDAAHEGRPRVRLGLPEIALIVLLAAISGLGLYKIVSTDQVEAPQNTGAVPVKTPAVVTPPATAGGGKAVTTTPKKSSAKTTAKTTTGGQATPVALADAANAATTSSVGSAQVPDTDADTPASAANGGSASSPSAGAE